MTSIFSYIFQLVVVSLALGGKASAAPVLAFGDLRGHMEPCGCDPRTDVGGLKRISASLIRYRSEHPNLIVVHSGNLFPKVIKDKTEADGISRALERLSPDASLINEIEWGLLSSGEKLPNVKWVLSNVSDNAKVGDLSQLIRLNGVEIFGYLGRVDKNLRQFDTDLLKKWKAQSKITNNENRVLIFSGSDAELEKIVKSKFFGVIISSNSTKLGIEKGDQEQRDEESLARRYKNRFLAWSVPYGGGGFLRQGGLELTAPPKTLASSLAATGENKSAAKVSLTVLTSIQPLHWLKLGEENGAPESVTKIFDDVREANRRKFRLLADQRVRDLPMSGFIGAEACASCHASSYDSWKKSKHSSAMASLLKRERHEDSGCVECHVVGFTAKGGYVNEQKSPNFSNVQCENCHGPRREHASNPSQSPRVDARASCAECHTPPHSPGFEMKSYWKMIEHK
jgi:hypothetical protein